MKHLLEYAEPCEIIEQTIDGYKVRITKPNETIEKIVKYEPIENVFEYDSVLVSYEGKYARLKKYTKYLKNNKLVRAYKKNDISRHSDDMIYESEIGTKYIVAVQTPFLSREEIEKLLDTTEQEKSIHKKNITEYKKIIKGAEKNISDIDRKYDIESKCEHVWNLEDEEEMNNGKTTKRTYICEHCGKEDNQYWHSLF